MENEKEAHLHYDDNFMNVGMSLKQWLSKNDKTHTESFMCDFEGAKKKISLFEQAINMYFKESGETDLRALRKQPMVIENYYPTECGQGEIVTWFYFKEDNNGTTYKFKAEAY